MADISIVPYSERPAEFYRQRADHLFYAPDWIQVMIDTYDFAFYTALSTTTNHLMIFAVVDRPVGAKIISLPFSDYTMLDTEQAQPLIAAIRQAYPMLPMVLRVVTDDDAPALLGQPIRQAYYHRIATADGAAPQDRWSSSFRRGERKAKRAELEVLKSSDQKALKEFYALYHQLRLHKFASIPQPYAFFEQVWKKFITTGQGFILQARRQGEMIAAIVVLRHKDVWYYKFGCSALDSLTLRPNNLLFAELIRMAEEDPDTVEIDLGLSGTSDSYAGLVRFKESMGGQRRHITYYEEQPEGYDPVPEQKFKKMLSSLTKTIVDQKLDVSATDQLSQTLYPYFL